MPFITRHIYLYTLPIVNKTYLALYCSRHLCIWKINGTVKHRRQSIYESRRLNQKVFEQNKENRTSQKPTRLWKVSNYNYKRCASHIINYPYIMKKEAFLVRCNSQKCILHLHGNSKTIPERILIKIRRPQLNYNYIYKVFLQ